MKAAEYSLEKTAQSFLKAFPFPPVLFKIVSMIKEDKEPLLKLGQEIAKDPVLSAKILSVVNSPYYATKQKVSDLPRAISLLGYDEVSTVIMRFVSREALAGSKAGQSSALYNPRQNWLHSVKTAHITRILLRRENLPLLLEGYLAGLMHDIGKNAIAVSIRPEDERKIARGLNKGVEPLKIEEFVLGFNHVQCGLEILKPMNVSLKVINMIGSHHNNMTPDFKQPEFLLALANLLSKFEEREDDTELDNHLNKRFSMNSADFIDLEKIYEELKIDMEFL